MSDGMDQSDEAGDVAMRYVTKRAGVNVSWVMREQNRHQRQIAKHQQRRWPVAVVEQIVDNRARSQLCIAVAFARMDYEKVPGREACRF